MAPLDNRSHAATLIQKHFRGFQARKQRDMFLIDKVYSSAVAKIIEKPHSLYTMPRSKEGKTPVFFPQEYPQIIIKLSGEHSYTRFRQMLHGKRVCFKKGYSHLVIPKVRMVKDCLVEERLPLKTHPFDQAKAYLDNLEACSRAIEEFAHFVLQKGITDMKRDFSMFQGLGFPRVDNFPLFLNSNKQWAIGLIDLEHSLPFEMDEYLDKADLEALRKKAICDLVFFYPYHVSSIHQVAKQYLDEETIVRLPLDQAADEGKRYLEMLVPNFLLYLKQRRDMTADDKELLIDELLKLFPIRVHPKNMIVRPRDDSNNREALASYIDKALQFLSARKAEKMSVSNNLFGQCLLSFDLSELPQGPLSYDKLVPRFLELLVELGIIYHYCPPPPGPGRQTIIF